ncbi:MAG TPA: TIM-barrel domain-containing protein, partial [Vicinamibacterales bacterium]
MTQISRREALRGIGAAAAGCLFCIDGDASGQAITIGGRRVTARVASISPHTLRVMVTPADARADLNWDGALAGLDQREKTVTAGSTIKLGELTVAPSTSPLEFRVSDARGTAVQDLTLDAETGALHFTIGNAPVLGFGEGGAQFDRRGVVDQMRNGQGGYQLRTHGGRVPIQWLIGTSGWALFIHQPFGTFDLKGPSGTVTPTRTDERSLPLDCFVVVSKDPGVIMREYAHITGLPEMPPLWSFGYQQSHRTLSGPDEIMWVAKTMREKKLPCDALIYLGTDFCPSGWNT